MIIRPCQCYEKGKDGTSSCSKEQSEHIFERIATLSKTLLRPCLNHLDNYKRSSYFKQFRELTPEQKAKELQDNLNNEIQKVTQQYFDGAICFDEIIIGVQMVLMKYRDLENNAVNDITTL